MIRRLMHGNAVNPGFQAASAVELADAPENLEENVLKNVGGFTLLSHHVGNQVKQRVLIDSQEVGKGLLRTPLQLRDERGFVADSGSRPVDCNANGAYRVHYTPKIAVSIRQSKANREFLQAAFLPRNRGKRGSGGSRSPPNHGESSRRPAGITEAITLWRFRVRASAK